MHSANHNLCTFKLAAGRRASPLDQPGSTSVEVRVGHHQRCAALMKSARARPLAAPSGQVCVLLALSSVLKRREAWGVGRVVDVCRTRAAVACASPAPPPPPRAPPGCPAWPWGSNRASVLGLESWPHNVASTKPSPVAGACARRVLPHAVECTGHGQGVVQRGHRGRAHARLLIPTAAL